MQAGRIDDEAGGSKPASKAGLSTGQWLALAAFDGPVQAFWGHYLQMVGQAVQARRLLLLAGSVGQPWKALAQWPAQAVECAGDSALVLELMARLPPLQPLLQHDAQSGHALAMRLPQAPVAPGQVAAVLLLRAEPFDWPDPALLAWAALVAAVPGQFAQRSASRAEAQPLAAVPDPAAHPAMPAAPAPSPAQDEPVGSDKARRLHEILLLGIRLQRHEQFLPLAFDLCNALAERFACDRVSLGWAKGPYLQLKAISHVEKFDPHSQMTRALESALEEAADQAGELRYPQPEHGSHVARAHESYALMQGVGAIASLPLRLDEVVQGVLCLERRQGEWTEAELWELRLIASNGVRRLADLHERDRWWGARWAARAHRGLSALLGPTHTLWKFAGIVSASVLLLLTFMPWNFKIDARLTLRSKDLLFMPAPFDGYLRSAQVEIGDPVKAGQVLVELDTRDLVLEESMAQADVMRFGREMEKSRAAGDLAEMQINLARQEQSAARLALIRHQLGHAQVKAPHDGVVVEGELKKNLGAPLRKGDLLVKLAWTDDNYLELEIDQVDVHEVAKGSRGEFALVGRPDQRFAIEIERIDPAATSREGRNVYLARAKVDGGLPAWWRPGMGGTAKIEAGERSLLWVLTHRTVRFLREEFWL